MRSLLSILTVVLVSLTLFGCGGTAPNTNTAVNTNTSANNANNPLTTTKKTPEPTTNDAPTLTPVYKAYCTALEKGDEAGLRKVYSADTLKSLEADMKRDNIKSLLKLLEDEKTTAAQCSARNEVITGDTAVAEIKAPNYPNGFKIVFVKEGGAWKMTTRSPEIDSVTKAAPSNSK